MTVERLNTSADILDSIVSGRTPGEPDRGGRWSPDYGLWVDAQIFSIMERMDPREQRFVEGFVPTALSVSRLFAQQLRDGERRVMWPEDVYGEDGAELLINASASNPTLNDPYSLAREGLYRPTIPYSRAYPIEISRLRHAITNMSQLDSPSAVAHHNFLMHLLEAYTHDHKRTSDLPYIRRAEVEWVAIPPDVHLLMFALPMEVYYDPLRIRWSGNERVNEWSGRVAQDNGLGPWRNYYEARLLLTDESMIAPSEVEAVRRISRQLYGDQVPDVSASTEFRRVLISSGNGAHPMKTAKNYLNIADIRQQIGYKNIHYTNMIRLGTIEKIIPWLQHTFGDEVLEGLSEAMLIRGRALGIVGHEENHPFRRFDGNQELEELKATINGLWAVITSQRFSEPDIRAALLTNIGSMLNGKAEIDKMRASGDLIGAGSRDTYHIGNTIFMNILVQNGVFTEGGNIDFDSMKTAIRDLVNSLEQYWQNRTGILADNNLRDERVWAHFSIKDAS